MRCWEITIEDVSFLQWSSVWDAMANDFIDGRAAGLGKVVVVERGRVAVPRCASLDKEIMGKRGDERDYIGAVSGQEKLGTYEGEKSMKRGKNILHKRGDQSW